MSNEMNTVHGNVRNDRGLFASLLFRGGHVAEPRRDGYWLHVVTDCGANPAAEGPIKDPLRLEWHEVTRREGYGLFVNTVTMPMQVTEDVPPYGAPET